MRAVCPTMVVVRHPEVSAAGPGAEGLGALRPTNRVGDPRLAILLLLARLGLRACEVVSLNLDDIQWHEGRILLCGKGRRWAQLPLLHEIGEALARYLQQARPPCASRRVFVRARAPWQGFANSSAIC